MTGKDLSTILFYLKSNNIQFEVTRNRPYTTVFSDEFSADFTDCGKMLFWFSRG